MTLPFRENIQRFFSQFLRSVQLDTDRSFLLEMNSSGELKVCGIRDVQGFDEKNILVLSDKLITEINGENLMMHTFSDSQISVSGEINSIRFIKR